MKRLRFLFAALAVFALLGNKPLYAAVEESIHSYYSYITIHEDGSLTVKEVIKVMSLGARMKHGIYRDFPTTYRNKMGNTVKVGFKVLEVLRDAKEIPYSVKPQVNGQRVYLGSHDKLMERGLHTFELTYLTTKQLGFFEKYDELYWNVTGNDWEFPIGRVEAIVNLPPNTKIGQTAAYTGPAGAQGKDFRISPISDSRIAFITTRTLTHGEGLTVAVSWPKGVVHEPTKQEKAAELVHDNYPALATLVLFVFLLTYYLIVWYVYGRDERSGIIVPLFQPPENISPAEMNFIHNMGFHIFNNGNAALSASVVDLAVRGQMKIVENNGEFTLTKTDGDAAKLFDAERGLLASLFSDKKSVELKSQSNLKLHETRSDFLDMIKSKCRDVYFVNNRLLLIPGLMITLTAFVALYFAALDRSLFFFMSFWLSIWTVGVFILGARVITLWHGVIAGKVLGIVGAVIMSVLFAGFLLGEILGLVTFASVVSVPIFIVMLLILTTNACFYYLLKKPTLRGCAIMDKIDGFKMYLSMAEKDRLEKLTPPKMTPALFEKYLPFAIALGVENQWGERFKNALTEAAYEKYAPAWYAGHYTGAHDFAASLGSGFSSALASSSGAPGSSSGSGGGGCSGGGGGGGGGGGF